MSYGRDYAKVDWEATVLSGGISGVLCFGLVMLLLALFMKKDAELSFEMDGQEYVIWLMCCILGGGYIMCKCRNDWLYAYTGILMLVYFTFCCITDYHTQTVYDVVQVVMSILLLPGIWWEMPSRAVGAELIVYGGIQAVVFRRMYGDADAMGFLICALSLVKEGMLCWAMHMAISFLLLGIVQGWKHNIKSDGNLKVPVPLYPYMAVAYLLVF